MATVLAQPITADDFASMPESAGRYELVQGEVVARMSPGAKHARIATKLSALLDAWAQQSQGFVGVESGYRLQRAPDTVRIPDISYVRADRIPAEGIPDGFWLLAPDLAVEIVSPSETVEMVDAKVSDLLAAGTAMVWVVLPSTRKVIVHTPDGLARTYGREATLGFPDLLPGFSCTVAQVMGDAPSA